MFPNIAKSYYINLKNRIDKNQYIINEFKKFNLLTDLERFEALTPLDIGFKKIGKSYYNENNEMDEFAISKACLFSHIEIIKMAKKLKLPNVLIFEDDVKFYDDYYDPIDIINQSMLELNDIDDWDVLYIGTNSGNTPFFKKKTKHIVKINEGIGTHSYLINNKIYDKLIENYHNNFAMDIMINNLNLNLYMIYPMVTYQNKGILNDISYGVPIYGFDTDFWLNTYKKDII